MDREAWEAAFHGVTTSRTRLSDFTFTFHFHALEKKMATHSSVLAWRIPGMGEPGGLPSMESHRVRQDWSDLAAAAAAASHSSACLTEALPTPGGLFICNTVTTPGFANHSSHTMRHEIDLHFDQVLCLHTLTLPVMHFLPFSLGHFSLHYRLQMTRPNR